MYKALKSAQNEIQEALLKFADETSNVGQKVDTSKCPRGEPCQCALITQSRVPSASVVSDNIKHNERFDNIEANLEFIHQKQNAQYEVLVKGIQELNINLTNIVKILSAQSKDAVETATTIPNLAPSAKSTDLKDVCIDAGFSHVGHVSDIPMILETPMDIDDGNESAIEADDDMTGDIDDVVPEDADDEVVPEDADDEVVPEEEEEGIEVEEWTFKGRKYFKDTENTVYANNNGEIGDPIGLYDPTKNVVKKLPTSS